MGASLLSASISVCEGSATAAVRGRDVTGDHSRATVGKAGLSRQQASRSSLVDQCLRRSNAYCSRLKEGPTHQRLARTKQWRTRQEQPRSKDPCVTRGNCAVVLQDPIASLRHIQPISVGTISITMPTAYVRLPNHINGVQCPFVRLRQMPVSVSRACKNYLKSQLPQYAARQPPSSDDRVQRFSFTMDVAHYQVALDHAGDLDPEL